MGRPKTQDPRKILRFRLKSSLIEKYLEMGKDGRQAMEDDLYLIKRLKEKHFDHELLLLLD